MKELFKYSISGLGLFLFIAIILVSFSGTVYYFTKPFFTPVDNTAFKESAQYNDGMIRDLENLRLEYSKATPEQQEAMTPIIIHRFSIYPHEKLPPHLQQFITAIH